MKKNWEVMQAATERGIENEEHSVSGLTGGDAEKIYAYAERGYLGTRVLHAAAYAVGVSEVNAVMGRIVACPTAGSCGIVPAALYAAREQRRVSEEAIVGALFTAAGIGMVVDQNASIAGAAAGRMIRRRISVLENPSVWPARRGASRPPNRPARPPPGPKPAARPGWWR